MDLGKLISDAMLDFGFASGMALGAVLPVVVSFRNFAVAASQNRRRV